MPGTLELGCRPAVTAKAGCAALTGASPGRTNVLHGAAGDLHYAACVKLGAAVVVAATLLALFPGASVEARRTVRAPHAEDVVLVAFDPGATPAQRRGAIRSLEPLQNRPVSRLDRGLRRVKLPPGLPVERALAIVARQAGVRYAEPDYLVQAVATSDDPYFLDGSLWGMYGPDSDPSGTFGSAAAEAWASGATGSRQVYVGVVDSGLQHGHEDLAANVWLNPFDPVDGIDNDGNGYVDDVRGWDFFNDDASTFDGLDDDHGTHVAGTMGARGGNGIGVAGVSWRVTMISAKFIDGEHGYISGAVRALDYLTDLRKRHGLRIVASSNSWAGGGHSQALLAAINRGADAGILFVAAAGNQAADNDATPSYPSSYQCTTRQDKSASRGWDCVVAVASITSSGGLSSFSNHGAVSVDLGAPGSGIWSTVPTSNGGSGYAKLSGTSMATPHVSGAIALCASLDTSLKARDLRQLLLESVTSTASLDGRTVTGGRLDVGALIERCRPDGPGPGSASIEIDDLSADFRRSGTAWRGSSTGYLGHSFWARTRSRPWTARGTWRPGIDESAPYEVKVRIPRANATTRAALYRIRTTKGVVKVRLDQAANLGRWASLGVYQLGTDAFVRLNNRTGEAWSSKRRVAFDAIRLIPTDETALSGASVAGSGAQRSRVASAERRPEPVGGARDVSATEPDVAATQPEVATSGPDVAATEPEPAAVEPAETAASADDLSSPET